MLKKIVDFVTKMQAKIFLFTKDCIIVCVLFVPLACLFTVVFSSIFWSSITLASVIGFSPLVIANLMLLAVIAGMVALISLIKHYENKAYGTTRVTGNFSGVEDAKAICITKLYDLHQTCFNFSYGTIIVRPLFLLVLADKAEFICGRARIRSSWYRGLLNSIIRKIYNATREHFIGARQQFSRQIGASFSEPAYQALLANENSHSVLTDLMKLVYSDCVKNYIEKHVAYIYFMIRRINQISQSKKIVVDVLTRQALKVLGTVHIINKTLLLVDRLLQEIKQIDIFYWQIICNIVPIVCLSNLTPHSSSQDLSQNLSTVDRSDNLAHTGSCQDLSGHTEQALIRMVDVLTVVKKLIKYSIHPKIAGYGLALELLKDITIEQVLQEAQIGPPSMLDYRTFICKVDEVITGIVGKINFRQVLVSSDLDRISLEDVDKSAIEKVVLQEITLALQGAPTIELPALTKINRTMLRILQPQLLSDAVSLHGSQLTDFNDSASLNELIVTEFFDDPKCGLPSRWVSMTHEVDTSLQYLSEVTENSLLKKLGTNENPILQKQVKNNTQLGLSYLLGCIEMSVLQQPSCGVFLGAIDEARPYCLPYLLDVNPLPDRGSTNYSYEVFNTADRLELHLAHSSLYATICEKFMSLLRSEQAAQGKISGIYHLGGCNVLSSMPLLESIITPRDPSSTTEIENSCDHNCDAADPSSTTEIENCIDSDEVAPIISDCGILKCDKILRESLQHIKYISSEFHETIIFRYIKSIRINKGMDYNSHHANNSAMKNKSSNDEEIICFPKEVAMNILSFCFRRSHFNLLNVLTMDIATVNLANRYKQYVQQHNIILEKKPLKTPCGTSSC